MIEDVDYLKKNSESDSIAVFADSSLRDQSVWPTPAEYVIEFTQPFRNVYGFEILDAAVPTTMYNVDVYNCKLYITIIKPSNPVLYLPNLYADMLSYSPLFVNLFEREVESFMVYILNTTPFTPSLDQLDLSTYIVCIENVVENANIEPVKNIPPEKDWGDYFYWFNNNRFYRCRYDDEDTYDLVKDLNNFVKPNMNGGVDLYYFTFQNVDVAEYTRITGDPRLYIVTFGTYRKSIELGNYDIPTLKTELNSVYNPIQVYFESTTAVETKQGILRIRSFQYLLLNARKKSLAKNIGFDLFPTAADSSKYNPMRIGDNSKVFATYKDTVSNSYVILAPGIINLAGERFLILRCKEIEDHLYGSFSYSSFIPGIAMFKMGAVNDISNLRFDYVSLVRKPIHPIGKLTKLTLRFETVDGLLYDFKGVNNQMLMMIKFYVPTQKKHFEKSILNPNYDSNFIDYMSRFQTIENHEASEEEEEFDDNKNFAIYKKKLETFDYSSSDEDEETSHESSEEDI